MKKCPFCAEEIQDAATVCKHCRRDLSPIRAAVAAALADPKQRRVIGAAAAIVGFLHVALTAGAGFGLMMAWIGMALLLPGNAVVRWSGGLILGYLLCAAGLVFGGHSTLPPLLSFQR